jgi:hypothetical protein
MMKTAGFYFVGDLERTPTAGKDTQLLGSLTFLLPSHASVQVPK